MSRGPSASELSRHRNGRTRTERIFPGLPGRDSVPNDQPPFRLQRLKPDTGPGQKAPGDRGDGDGLPAGAPHDPGRISHNRDDHGDQANLQENEGHDDDGSALAPA